MAPLYPQPTAQSSSALTLDQILQMEEEGQRANQERERGRKWALEMQNRQQLRPKQGLAEHQLLDEQQKAQQLVEEQQLAEQQRLVEQRQREQMEKKQRRQQQREQTRAHQQQQYTARQQHYMAQQLFLQQVQALSLANPHLSPQQISMMLLMQQQAQRAQTPQYHQHHASPPPPLQQQQQRAPAQFHWMPATGQQLVTPISGNYEYMAVSQMPSAPSPAAAFNWPPPRPPASASSSMTLSSVATAPPSPAAAWQTTALSPYSVPTTTPVYVESLNSRSAICDLACVLCGDAVHSSAHCPYARNLSHLSRRRTAIEDDMSLPPNMKDVMLATVDKYLAKALGGGGS
ncbi:hypothetical protein IWW38_003725 [Coemansia aciculifera]|uniref:Uncharacterized protein n=1 Tax=Coemansia aciculifera TaxID=417176 RepID=A0ACC1M1E6_9FUNG|nr:hypothetical protein IWW38_003725 [Coemansia aciculifera]